MVHRLLQERPFEVNERHSGSVAYMKHRRAVLSAPRIRKSSFLLERGFVRCLHASGPSVFYRHPLHQIDNTTTPQQLLALARHFRNT
jgi:hypothetical protein